MYACLKEGKDSVKNQHVRFQLPVCPFDTRLPGLSVIEATHSMLGGGVPLMSTPPCRCYACHTCSLYGGT